MKNHFLSLIRLLLSFAMMVSACFTNAQTPAAKKETPAASTPAPAAKKEEAPASAPAEKDLLTSLEYPELQVVPRATDRLALEAQYEKDNRVTLFWPIQISALSTIATGFLLKGKYKESLNNDGTAVVLSENERRDADFWANASIGVGAAWLGLTYYLTSQETYSSDLNKIRRNKGSDKKSDLLRERLAEETLQKQADLVRTLTTASVVTNFIANAAMYNRSTTSNNLYPIIGVATSLLPLVFKSRYVDNYEKHLEYKRKIYTPLTSFDYRPILNAERKIELQPTLQMSWIF